MLCQLRNSGCEFNACHHTLLAPMKGREHSCLTHVDTRHALNSYPQAVVGMNSVHVACLGCHGQGLMFQHLRHLGSALAWPLGINAVPRLGLIAS